MKAYWRSLLAVSCILCSSNLFPGSDRAQHRTVDFSHRNERSGKGGASEAPLMKFSEESGGSRIKKLLFTQMSLRRQYPCSPVQHWLVKSLVKNLASQWWPDDSGIFLSLIRSDRVGFPDNYTVTRKNGTLTIILTFKLLGDAPIPLECGGSLQGIEFKGDVRNRPGGGVVCTQTMSGWFRVAKGGLTGVVKRSFEWRRGVFDQAVDIDQDPEQVESGYDKWIRLFRFKKACT